MLLEDGVARKHTKPATSSAVDAFLSGTFATTESRTLAAASAPRPLVNHGVSIYPGQTVLTRINGANERARESAKVFRAPLLVASAPDDPWPWRPAADDTLTTADALPDALAPASNSERAARTI